MGTLQKITLILFLSFVVPSPPLLAKEPGRLEQEVADLRRLQETNGKTLAETVQSLTTVRQEMQELKGALEETQHFFKDSSANSERLLREFDYRLTGMEERLSLLGNQMNDFLLKPAAPEPKGKGNKAKGKAPAESEGDTLYRRALSEINLQNYRAALPLFDQYLKKFPRSHLAGNAQYWKGETLYASKDYPNAILEFQKVVKNHAKSEKVPGAVLKQGYCFYEMQNFADSKTFLQKVIADYPTSGEAAQAKERLHKIEQLPTKKASAPSGGAPPPPLTR